MNKQELRDILQREGFRPDVYDLDGGGHSTEVLVLSEANGAWFVYYSERGLQTGKRRFSTEDEACEYMLKILRKDPTTRR